MPADNRTKVIQITDQQDPTNSITFGSDELDKIQQGPQLVSSISPVLLDLPWDVADFGVITRKNGPQFFEEIFGNLLATQSDELLYIDEGDIMSLPQGSEVSIRYKSGENLSKMYLKSMKATGNNGYDIQAQSAIGVLESQFFMGNYYQAETFPNIISDIISGSSITFTIAPELQTIMLTGAIPPMSKRRALSAVLLATGASITRDAAGTLVIQYNNQSEPRSLAPIGIGGQRLYYERATKVTVTEHSFFTSAVSQEEVLFDNTADVNVINYTIYFDDPVQTFRADGITLVDSGPYYATLTGVGVLYGVYYVHVKREVSKSTGIDGPEKELRIDDCTMITPANAATVLNRIVNYETNVQLAQVDALVTTEKAGDLVQFTDPYEMQTETGYIINMNKTLSLQDKAQLTIAEKWQPGYFGNAYDSYMIVTAADLTNGNWTVPSSLQGKEGLVVLFSGAQGGQGGYAGRSPGKRRGGTPYYVLRSSDTADTVIGGGSPQPGGAGGSGGRGGSAATHILNININSFANSYPVTFGAGGAGGAGGTATWGFDYAPEYTDPEDGSPGGDSTFNGLSTAQGANFSGTYINLVTGDVIATDGATGTAGGAGGNGGASLQLRYIAPYSTAQADLGWTYDQEGKGGTGGGVGSNTGGTGALGKTKTGRFLRASYAVPQDGWYGYGCGGGGGGGGAAAGANGSAGTQASVGSISVDEYSGGQLVMRHTYHYANYTATTDDDETYYGGFGGNGANAVTIPAQAPLYQGGTGGAGGGGGGGCGAPLGWFTSYTGNTDNEWGKSHSGKGGNGAQGGQGSDGFMVVYWRASA